ncbi:hypothetical protein M427DRAFT_134843 [Gonapodya prolifera JEL478]|uniref:Uncharacterized protein n=1 Tax=Gonapodya prolifera (strain JEL478) TaxID=1344416 RepID=A0A139AG91_GONPJ|nr:hypothetical protein M427DRAFT_134843 [Gonapodya prolifera JEL478]|eukprot:KXS15816.1 hypothetical protein M427DRAFT_134843 [Gonapodya prolifera JEL478]
MNYTLQHAQQSTAQPVGNVRSMFEGLHVGQPAQIHKQQPTPPPRRGMWVELDDEGIGSVSVPYTPVASSPSEPIHLTAKPARAARAADGLPPRPTLDSDASMGQDDDDDNDDVQGDAGQEFTFRHPRPRDDNENVYSDSDYRPSSPDDDTAARQLTTSPSIRVDLPIGPPGSDPLEAAWVTRYEAVPPVWRDMLLRNQSSRSKNYKARGFDTYLRVKADVELRGGSVDDMAFFFLRAYRFNPERRKWSTKGPIALFLLPDRNAIVGYELYSTRAALFTIPIFDDILASIKPLSQLPKSGGIPRHLLFVHTLGRSAVRLATFEPRALEPAPEYISILHTIPEEQRAFLPTVQMMYGGKGVTVAREADGEETQGGRRWCWEFVCEAERTQCLDRIRALARNIGPREVARRAATFGQPRAPVAAELDGNRLGSIGVRAPELARYHAERMAGTFHEWRNQEMAELYDVGRLAEAGFQFLPLVFSTGLALPAMVCVGCGFTVANPAWFRGSTDAIVRAHKESTEARQAGCVFAGWGGR